MKRWLFAGLFCALASVARLTVFGQAPAQPILLVVNTATNAANPYGPYLAEILRAEGVNSFDVVDLASMTASDLSAHRLVVLGEAPLLGSQASDLSA